MASDPTPRNHWCSIVPPYILDALSRSSDEAVARVAERTKQHDELIREQRQAGPGQVRPEKSPGAPATDQGQATDTAQRTIYDAQQKTTLPGKQVRAEGEAATDDVAVTEAYDGLGDTWKLFHDIFGRASIDDKGLPLIGTVHYGKKYDNAFWNGEQMVFGDGDGVVFNRFTSSVDVMGHELTHGVTQYTAALVYSDQPGALNESVSDVFGSLVKQYALGQTADQADWLIGAGLLAPGIKGVALRSMIAPGTAYDDPQLGKDPQPDSMAGYVDTSDDNGGVHINSGIPNRAFALVAKAIGGHAWEKAGQIWYDVLTGTQIQARCDFGTFAALTIAAAGERYGAASAEQTAVQQAWQTVGVTPTEKPAKKTKKATPKTTGSAGSDAAPPLTTPVSIRRTGGFAGTTKERDVQLDQLPASDAKHWQSLLASSELSTLSAEVTPEATPDGFVYHVRCTVVHLDVTVPEQELPTQVRDLFHRTLAKD